MADYQGIHDTNSSSYSGNDSLVQGTSVAPTHSPRGIIEKHPVAYFLETYYSFFLLIFGTVGNLLSLAVLSRKAFRTSPIGTCLRFLALADMTALYTGPLYFSAIEVFGHNFRLTNEASCRIHRWVSYIAVDLSAWTLVVVSTTRLVSVVWPMKNIFNRKKTLITLIVTLFVIIGVNSPSCFLYGIVVTRSGRILCGAVTPSFRYFTDYIWVWIVFAKLTILPAMILFVMNIFLVSRVIGSRRHVEGISGEDRPRMSMSVIGKAKLTINKWKKAKELSRDTVAKPWKGQSGKTRSPNNELTTWKFANGKPGMNGRVVIDNELTSDFRLGSEYRISMETILSTVTETELMAMGNHKTTPNGDQSLPDCSTGSSSSNVGDQDVSYSRTLLARSKSDRNVAAHTFPHSRIETQTKMGNTLSIQRLNRCRSLSFLNPYRRAKEEENGHFLSSGFKKEPRNCVKSTENCNTIPEVKTSHASINSNAIKEGMTSQASKSVSDVNHDIKDIASKETRTIQKANSERSLILPVIEISMDSNTGSPQTEADTRTWSVTDIRDIIINNNINSICSINKNNSNNNNNNDYSSNSIEDERTNNNLGVQTNNAIATIPKASDVIDQNTNLKQHESQLKQITSSRDSLHVCDKRRAPSPATAPDFKCAQGHEGQGSATDRHHFPEFHSNNHTRDTNLLSTSTNSLSDSSICGVNRYQKSGASASPKGSSSCRSRGHSRSTRKSGADHRTQRHRNLTVTVIVVNAIFLICNLPIAIYMAGREYMFTGKKTVASTQYVVEIFSNYILYTSNAINFLLYCITGSRFRQELKNMFRQCWSIVSRCCSRKR